MQLPVDRPQPQTRPRRLAWKWLFVVPSLLWAAFHWTPLGRVLHEASLQAVVDRGGIPTASTFDNAWRVLKATPERGFAALNGAPLELLILDIPYMGMERLRAKREEALRVGFMVKEDDADVGATLRHRDRTIDVKVRLKGDLPDHLYGNKWSLRIEGRRDGQVLGMSDFAVQHPITKGFAAEAVFLAHCRLRGLLAPRYFLIDLVVNGERKGLMAVEERPTTEMLESQQRRDGPLLRFDENLRFDAAKILRQDINFSGSYPLVSAFRETRAQRVPKLREDLDTAKSMLRAVVEGTLPASQAFDVRLWARYLAICELWGASHALAWNNLRFYWNPTSARLEPIGFDANVGNGHYLALKTLSVAANREQDNVAADTLQDPIVRDAFFKALREEIDALADGRLRGALAIEEQRFVDQLRSEFPLVDTSYWQHPQTRVLFLQHLDSTNLETRQLMHPPFPAPTLPRLCHALLERVTDGYALSFVNLVGFPVEVHQLLRTDGGPLPPCVLESLPLTLPATHPPAPPALTTVHLPLTDSMPPALRVVARIVGNQHDHPVDAIVYPTALTQHPLAPMPVDQIVALFPFFEVTGPDVLQVRAGRHTVDRLLVFPEGAQVTFMAGAELRFAPDAGMIVSGRLSIHGTKEAPVRMSGWCGLDGQKPFLGIAVLDAKEVSADHLEMDGATGFVLPGFSLTAGFFVQGNALRAAPSAAIPWGERNAKVVLRDCVFRSSRTEDAVNLYLCQVELLRVVISNTQSDALDLDYCNGSLTDCVFEMIGGDAIDVSGSDITVHGGRITGARDKGISVGEGSRLVAENVVMQQCGTGFAVKDGSTGRLMNSHLQSCRVAGVMGYVKKSAFGPGRTEILRTQIEAPQKIVAQTGSEVWLDGVAVQTQAVDVDQLYQTVMKK